jgi:type IV pilus assembly protein PilC
MASYAYEAVNSSGLKIEGSVDVADQNEAIRRIKQMGLFPMRIVDAATRYRSRNTIVKRAWTSPVPILCGRVKPGTLAVFTRQFATLVEAGMPLLRGLRILKRQEENRTLKRVIHEIAASIENGGSLADGLAAHPRVFNALYLNMIKAGELAGALEVALRRLADFIEKAQRIKGRIKAAMFYPCAVMFVAAAILCLMMTFVVPRFREIFEGLLEGAAMPAFTMLVLNLSAAITSHILPAIAALFGSAVAFAAVIRTRWGRWLMDQFKLKAPILGPVFRKAAISRFARTLGTLLGNGVPILQALSIVRETVGNVVISSIVASIHDSVKEGGTVAEPLQGARVFPAMVAGMVDVGEQTGALPDMLMKIADNCDQDVDNAVTAMTSLLEPVLIVFLAVIVGAIVIALFLPLIYITTFMDSGGGGAGD